MSTQGLTRVTLQIDRHSKSLAPKAPRDYSSALPRLSSLPTRTAFPAQDATWTLANSAWCPEEL